MKKILQECTSLLQSRESFGKRAKVIVEAVKTTELSDNRIVRDIVATKNGFVRLEHINTAKGENITDARRWMARTLTKAIGYTIDPKAIKVIKSTTIPLGR
jgi:hypothetical protein